MVTAADADEKLEKKITPMDNRIIAYNRNVEYMTALWAIEKEE